MKNNKVNFFLIFRVGSFGNLFVSIPAFWVQFVSIAFNKRTIIIHTILNLRKSSGITDAVIHAAGADGDHEALVITWM